MDVLIVAKNDWANMGYRLQECLRKVGVDAKAVTLSINYSCKPKHAKICEVKNMQKYVNDSKIIQFMHSEFECFNLNISKKRVFVFHGGGRYRDNPNERNKIFNPIIEKSLIQTGDLWDLGAKNKVWVLPPVDVNLIQPVFNKNNRIVISHYPSSAKLKGSDIIDTVMAKIKPTFNDKFVYKFSDKRVSWKEQIKRLSKCDIYIEQMLLGEWGVTALEAASLGKIIVTNFKSYDKYLNEYGSCPIIPANSEEELVDVLVGLLNKSEDELLNLKKATRDWVCKNHSYEAVGKRLKEIVYEI